MYTVALHLTDMKKTVFSVICSKRRLNSIYGCKVVDERFLLRMMIQLPKHITDKIKQNTNTFG